MNETYDEAAVRAMKEIKSLEEIREGRYFIFKHSLICPSSVVAFREVADAESGMDIPVYQIIVQRRRDLSNEVARRFGIIHESPQMILVDGDRAVWNASHYDITAEALLKAAAAM